jgi:hypothetical protein
MLPSNDINPPLLLAALLLPDEFDEKEGALLTVLLQTGLGPKFGPPDPKLGPPAPKIIAAISLLQIFIFTLLEKFNCATQTL